MGEINQGSSHHEVDQHRKDWAPSAAEESRSDCRRQLHAACIVQTIVLIPPPQRRQYQSPAFRKKSWRLSRRSSVRRLWRLVLLSGIRTQCSPKLRTRNLGQFNPRCPAQQMTHLTKLQLPRLKMFSRPARLLSQLPATRILSQRLRDR